MSRSVFLLTIVVVMVPQGLLTAAPPAATSLLPLTTKGIISTPNFDLLEEHWQKTQLSQLMSDPIMQPFADDLERQFDERFSESHERFGISWNDIRQVCGGEICTARIQPQNNVQLHAMALIVDVTGKNVQAKNLLDQIKQSLLANGARHTTQKLSNVDVSLFSIRSKKNPNKSHFAYFFLEGDLLVACDDAATTGFILQRMGQPANDTIDKSLRYVAVTQRVDQASENVEPHIRWWIDPVPFAHVMRAARGGRQRRGRDMLKILETQGFDCVQGIGGNIYFAEQGKELIHRSYVYAPAIPDQPNGDRYQLAARMLDFPNSFFLQPEDWIPVDSAVSATFRWNVSQAFEHSKSLVNALSGEEIFEDLLLSLEKDPKGPKVNVRKDLVAHLGQKGVFISNFRLPITPDSERTMFGIELKNPDAVLATLNKAMQHEPDAKPVDVDGHQVWEVTRRESVSNSGISIGAVVQDDESTFPNSAITVITGKTGVGYLLIATHVDHIADVLKQMKTDSALSDAEDYQRVDTALRDLGAKGDSFRIFSRADKSYHTNYELLRRGILPQGKTFLASTLNKIILGPDQATKSREQELDGSKLPPFPQIDEYFGPSGAFVRSMTDGWYICGCVLTKGQGGASGDSE